MTNTASGAGGSWSSLWRSQFWTVKLQRLCGRSSTAADHHPRPGEFALQRVSDIEPCLADGKFFSVTLDGAGHIEAIGAA